MIKIKNVSYMVEMNYQIDSNDYITVWNCGHYTDLKDAVELLNDSEFKSEFFEVQKKSDKTLANVNFEDVTFELMKFTNLTKKHIV